MDHQRTIFKKFFNISNSNTSDSISSKSTESDVNKKEKEISSTSTSNNTSTNTNTITSFNPPKFQFNKKKLGVMIRDEEIEVSKFDGDDNEIKIDDIESIEENNDNTNHSPNNNNPNTNPNLNPNPNTNPNLNPNLNTNANNSVIHHQDFELYVGNNDNFSSDNCKEYKEISKRNSIKYSLSDQLDDFSWSLRSLAQKWTNQQSSMDFMILGLEEKIGKMCFNIEIFKLFIYFIY